MLTLHDIHKVAQERRKENEYLYAVFDGACRDNALSVLFSKDGVEDYHSLYVGTPYIAVLEYGPFLIRVRYESDFFQWFLEEGPYDHAGAFFFSTHSLIELHENFKDFIEIRMPDDSMALLRFYDPRFTRRALSLMCSAEREQFFNGISKYFIPRRSADNSVFWMDICGGSNV